mmetsp:Transcript_36905/g.41968  ORF Transcript_36905/g.41968 Transcript_36905/m.41968 type:complete len:314 (+) Transcript_36905:199-1140(+)
MGCSGSKDKTQEPKKKKKQSTLQKPLDDRSSASTTINNANSSEENFGNAHNRSANQGNATKTQVKSDNIHNQSNSRQTHNPNNVNSIEEEENTKVNENIQTLHPKTAHNSGQKTEDFGRNEEKMSNSDIQVNVSLENDEYDVAYKVVMAGDAFVGKSYLAMRFSKGTVPDQPSPTVGVEFTSKTVTLDSEKKVKIQLWDTAGMKKFRPIITSHFRRADAALIVYDITNEESFEHVPYWVELMREHAGPTVYIMIVGNKIDCRREGSKAFGVSTARGEEMAKKLNVHFGEMTASSPMIITSSFQKLAEELMVTK